VRGLVLFIASLAMPLYSPLWDMVMVDPQAPSGEQVQQALWSFLTHLILL